MFCWSRPDGDAIGTFLCAADGMPFSYAEVGASREGAPAGYTVLHSRLRIGQGADVFERAKAAIRQWKMFEMAWVELCPRQVAIKPGATAAVLISYLGFWSLNACRIVYVVSEPRQYGFAYGTLSAHAEIGEERFLVEYDRRDESVWYDLYSFSMPGTVARCGYPIARALQRRFARDSGAAMRKAVRQAGESGG
jgi:uncharacterized protein (UPF0548 family)